MVKERVRVTIEIDTKSDLARALRDRDVHSIILVSDGNEYEVVRAKGDEWTEENANRAREALRPAPGIFSPEEAEELKQKIYEWREAGTRPLS
jgi:post-segregation antitoxin (ccd killing protein)